MRVCGVVDDVVFVVVGKCLWSFSFWGYGMRMLGVMFCGGVGVFVVRIFGGFIF